MANLSHLEVNNFRCFDHVEVDGLTNVNLFVGKNSAGKSTLLEALSSAITYYPCFDWREFNEKDMNDFRYAFHNFDIGKDIDFQVAFLDGSIQSFRVSAKKYDASEIINGSKADSIKSLECSGAIYDGTTKVEETFLYSLVWEKDQKKFDNMDNPIVIKILSKNVVHLLSNGIEDEGMKKDYIHIVLRKMDDVLLNELRVFDSKIKNIRQIGDGIYFDVEGVKEYLPSNFMGNGFRRYFNIIVTLLSRNSAFACIDEIENGLHYSNLSKLWNALIQFSVRNNIQLFLTTHSLETMESLKNVLEDEAMTEYRDKVKVFKVAKTENKGYQTYGYGFNEFQTALNSLIEMR